MSKISVKDYFCPLCKAVSRHATNHIGEIYVTCKVCDNSVLYCQEHKRDEEYLEAVIQFYSFDLHQGQREYDLFKKSLCQMEQLNGQGYKMFDTFTHSKLWQHLKEYDNQKIKLYKPYTFDNQFVSDIGRVHYWYEAIFPNRRLKKGYWLEIIDKEIKK